MKNYDKRIEKMETIINRVKGKPFDIVVQGVNVNGELSGNEVIIRIGK